MILNIADNRPKTRYILALDESHSTLKEIVKQLVWDLDQVGLRKYSRKDALLNKEVTVNS